MSEPKGLILIRPNGKVEFEEYDDRYDIVIHCKNQMEQNRVLTTMRKADQMMREGRI